MKTFFDSLYYYLNGFYGTDLDSYLYNTDPGYLLIGLVMVICSLVICAVFYYWIAPVRKQTFFWLVCAAANAGINFLVALGYTMTPLINNEVDNPWTYLDCVMFGFTNIIWSFVFYVVWSLFIKWGSIAKYVPFQKF